MDRVNGVGVAYYIITVLIHTRIVKAEMRKTNKSAEKLYDEYIHEYTRQGHRSFIVRLDRINIYGVISQAKRFEAA